LSKLTSLRVLDLQKNNIDLPFDQTLHLLIKPLTTIPKLQYLSFEANPIETTIQNFRYLVIHHLQKLEFYNYVRITKEDRVKAGELAAANEFKQKEYSLSSVVVKAEAGDTEEKLNLLLSADSMSDIKKEIEIHEVPDFSALDKILDGIESPVVERNNELDSLLDDLQDIPVPMPMSNTEETKVQSSSLEIDPLDDILGYLDDEDASNISMASNASQQSREIEVAQPTPQETGIMGVATSQSTTNKPIAMDEDEGDYLELLGDMIAPSAFQQSPIPMKMETSHTDILSMLDELIEESQSDPSDVQQEEQDKYLPIQRQVSHITLNDADTRDSMEDMLLEIANEESGSPAFSALDSILSEEEEEEESEETNGFLPGDDQLDDLLSEMMGEDLNAPLSPKISKSPQLSTQNSVDLLRPPDLGGTNGDDDVLMNLLSAMEGDLPLDDGAMENLDEPQFDPLDELTSSLHQVEIEMQEKLRQEEALQLKMKQEELAKQQEIKQQEIAKREEMEAARKKQEEIKKQEMEAAQKRQEELKRQELEAMRKKQEEDRIQRELAAKKEREELAEREKALYLQRQEEAKRKIELEEKQAAERLRKLEEEEKRIEEELAERKRKEEQRRLEEEQRRIEIENQKQQEIEEKRQREEEELKRREEAEHLQRELEKKRLEAERKEKELRAQVEAKKQLLLKQQEEEEERQRRETEEMMRMLEEEQKREEQKRRQEEEEERRKMEERGYVDELVNQVDTLSTEDSYDELSNIQAKELVELRHMRFPYAIPLDDVQTFELLGGGTFGSCYRGIYQNKEVVLKKLNCNMIQDEYFMEQFKTEVSKLCVLQHPQLIDIRGVSILVSLAMVTEYVQGSPLFGLLRNRGVTFDIAEKIRLAQQIAMGLAHLHHNGIIYSGLKTKNILINNNNDVVLRDYGFLCIKDFVKKQGGVGTPQYTAPEVILEGESAHGFPEDIYSFGIVLWELFSGSTPFKGLMARQVIAAVTQKNIRPEEPLDCPVVMWKVMQSCWHPDPASRPDIDRLVKILHQPLENIMKYGLTAGSTEPPPRGAPIDPQAAYEAKQASSASPQDAETSKIHMVLRQVKEMLTSNNPELQSKAEKVLVNIGRTESNIKPILDNGILQILHTLLKSDNWAVREGSARALAVLAEWPQVEQLAIEEGILLTLLQNLKNPSDVVVLQCARALITFTKETASQKAVRACGGLHSFMALLDSPNEMFILQGVWAISHLLEDEQFQHDFHEASGIRKLLTLLSSTNPGIQFRVLVALGNMISNPKFYPVIEKAQILKRFLLLLNSNSPILRLQAAKAAERMSAKGALRTEITRNGGMATLIQLLQPDNDKELIIAGLNCLINFATDKKQILSFKEAGGLPAVLQVLENANHIVQYQGIRFFRQFVDKDDLNKEICRAIGFIPRCIGLLTSSHPGIQRTAVETLVEMTTSSKCIETTQAGGGLPPLLSLIDHASDEIKCAAITVIAAMIHRDDTVRETIVRAGSIKKIVHLLRNPELKVKEAAALVLCPLCVDQFIRNLMVTLNGIPSLANILRSTIQQNVQEAILSSFSTFLRDAQVHELMLQCGAAESILKLLNNPNAVVQTAAIRCTLLLCASGVLLQQTLFIYFIYTNLLEYRSKQRNIAIFASYTNTHAIRKFCAVTFP